MNPLNLGITIDQGADFSIVIGVFDMNGPVNLTGYSFLSQMSASTDPTEEPVASFSFTNKDQSVNPGQVTMSMSSNIVDAIELSISNSIQKRRLTTPFVFDIKMKDTVGNISRIVEGIIYVSPEATQEVF